MDLQENFLICWMASVWVSVLMSIGLYQSSSEKINALKARVQQLEQAQPCSHSTTQPKPLLLPFSTPWSQTTNTVFRTTTPL